MRSRRTGLLAGILLAAWVAVQGAASVLDRVNGAQASIGEHVPLLAGFFGIAAIGALLIARRPGNAIGRAFMAIALGTAAGNLTQQLAEYGLRTNPDALPAAASTFLFWLSSWLWPVSVMLAVFVLIWFPDGHPASPRWRVASRVVGGAVAAYAVSIAFRPGRLGDLREGPLNPFGIPQLGGVLHLLEAAAIAVPIALVAAAVSLVLRFRRARGGERQQIRWVMHSAVLLASILGAQVALGGILPDWASNLMFAAMLLTLPSGMAIAILRYRLYDLDRIVSRTLVYGVLTAGLGAAYLGSVAVLQRLARPLAAGGDLAVVGSTLGVAALFRPARRRVQALVDRRFYRRRYDAARTLDAFGRKLRDEVDLASLRAELTATVARTMQPVTVWVWLREAAP